MSFMMEEGLELRHTLPLPPTTFRAIIVSRHCADHCVAMVQSEVGGVGSEGSSNGRY